jgi:NADPH:quinone reductase
MGRSFDGSYAEYALLPISQIFTVHTSLDWISLAAIPETYFTAWGSLFDGMQLSYSDSLFIRGGSSALGLASIQLAKSIGCTVYATTRDSRKFELLKKQGADFTLCDDETLSDQFLSVCPGGVTKLLELVGITTFPQSVKFLAHHGCICVTGMLGHSDLTENFDPIKAIPNGVYLTSFYSNYPTQKIIDDIFAHIRQYNLQPAVGRVFPLEKIADAHLLMEHNTANGKIVITVDN